MWNIFDEDRKRLDAKLTTMERELSDFKVNESTFQQMKDMLSRLKVALTVQDGTKKTGPSYLIANILKIS